MKQLAAVIMVVMLTGCSVICQPSPATPRPDDHRTQMPGTWGESDTRCTYK